MTKGEIVGATLFGVALAPFLITFMALDYTWRGVTAVRDHMIEHGNIEPPQHETLEI